MTAQYQYFIDVVSGLKDSTGCVKSHYTIRFNTICHRYCTIQYSTITVDDSVAQSQKLEVCCSFDQAMKTAVRYNTLKIAKSQKTEGMFSADMLP